ncbi:MAG: ATP-dependent helicase [Spirochaetales bacterium]|nr:ATP-dependent helicase [Spirochaetales bacterium]
MLVEKITIENYKCFSEPFSITFNEGLTVLAGENGSGKTEVVGLKSAFAIKRLTDSLSGIAVLSFTRNAAKEINERVNKYAGPDASKHPHFVGTFDSWLHNFIFQPFAAKEMGFDGRDGDKRINVIDNELKRAFLSKYSTTIPQRKTIWVNEYFYLPDGDIEEATEGKLKGCDAQNLQQLEQNKKRFFEHGFATYQDAAYISYRLLKNNPSMSGLISKRFPCIIIDECQDLCYNQLMMLYYLRQSGARIHLIGDVNQSIYEFRKVSPEKLIKYVNTTNPIEKKLDINYRSNQCIVDACCSIIGDTSHIGHEKKRIVSPLILWQYESGELLSLPKTFRSYIESLDDKESHITEVLCSFVEEGFLDG